MRTPAHWAHDGWRARLLTPLSWLWRAGAALRRLRAKPWTAPVPVICIGNLSAGGAGKTPTAIAVAELCRDLGRAPHFLSRGHGGRLAGPARVDPSRHTAADVGDEPLLLAALAPTWIARDRAAGARAAVAAGAEVIVMDDGFQNPSLAKDLSLVVVDGAVGFGNGRMIPAGPLREPIAGGLARADALVIVGDDAAGTASLAGAVRPDLPVWRARLEPAPTALALAGSAVVAFAGIGRPAKFFDMLKEVGARLVTTHAFPDHHNYRTDQIMKLCELADAAGARPVTTFKDYVRLSGEARAMVTPVGVALTFAAPDAVLRKLTQALGDGSGR